MAEKQVSAGGQTRQLSDLFMVMATQNPIEQEGTYALPEAQLDRFLMHVKIDYPEKEAETKILELVENEARQIEIKPIQPISQANVFKAREEVLNLHMADAVKNYIVELVMATRHPQKYSVELAKWIEYGVSPRATMALSRTARAYAWLKGQDFISPEEVQAVAKDVMRHRLLLTYEAEAEGLNTDDVIDQIIQWVPVV